MRPADRVEIPTRAMPNALFFLCWNEGKEIREPHYGGWILRLREWMPDEDGNEKTVKAGRRCLAAAGCK